jgi:hypothetical protein
MESLTKFLENSAQNITITYPEDVQSTFTKQIETYALISF